MYHVIHCDRVFPYRPAMLLSITGTIVSFVLFGFSENFVWAVCAWLLWGLLDGVICVSKTYLSEVCNPCVVKWIIFIVMEFIIYCYPMCH